MAVQELRIAEGRGYRRRGHLARAFRRLLRKKIAIACLVTLLVIYAGGIFANWVIFPSGLRWPLEWQRYGYADQDYTVIRQPPSWEHWAGTDRAGRDLFTRVLWGIQNTVILTVVGMMTGGLVLGVTLGLVSGYFGKKIDALIMRTGEVISTVPTFFLLLIIAVTLRPRVLQWVRWVEDNTAMDGLVRSGIVDYIVISLALVIFSWFGMARLVRGQILYLKETQHVEAARAIGASTPRLLFRHLLPNAISPIVVTVTMGMGTMVGVEIFLSWIGLGIQPPRPSLGVMLWEGMHISVLRSEPWMLLAPGTAAFLMILAWNLLGDALSDVLNPRTR